jgi:hypothetical protein
MASGEEARVPLDQPRERGLMAAPRREPDEERRRLFRRMEWVFVYAPPLLAVFIAGLRRDAFLAFFVPDPGTDASGAGGRSRCLILGVPRSRTWGVVEEDVEP